MNKLAVTALSMAAATGLAATTAQDQAYLAILAETKLMKMVGMPEMPELPEGIMLPDVPGMPAMPGKASRSLTVRLWSPSIAPAGATATLIPPKGLLLGDKLDLELYRPKPTETGSEGGQGFDPDKMSEFTIKMYWGSSETVREGQPKVFSWKTLTPEQKAEMQKRAREAQNSSSYFYKPNWTTGYWPTSKQPGKIANNASLVGTYTLNTSYTGSVSVDAPANVEFLPAIEMSSPNLSKKIAFDKFIPFEWAPVTGALGQYASIMGMEGQNTLILWSSSENFKEHLMGDQGFLQMAEVRQHVADNVFMPPTTTKVTVPAGIFKNADMAMLNMVAYGSGSALEKGQPLPRIQTKSTLNIMLGGKQMNFDMDDE
ncbi:MAG TPA: hypothetical protein VGE01_02575 [Fimbriimonas sp.]